MTEKKEQHTLRWLPLTAQLFDWRAECTCGKWRVKEVRDRSTVRTQHAEHVQEMLGPKP